MSDPSGEHQQYDTLLKLLTSKTMDVRVKIIEDLFQKQLQTGNIEWFVKNVLVKILPEIIDIQRDILRHNETVMLNNTNSEVQDDILEDLQNYLKMSMQLVKAVNQFLTIIVSIEELDCEYYYFIPTNVNALLYSTLIHCKDSQETYKHYFEKLQDLTVNLFQDAELVQQTLFKCVAEQFLSQPGNKLQDEFLSQFLDSLSDIARIVFGLNTKLLASTWRCYSDLVKKYGAELTTVDVIKPLSILFYNVTLTISPRLPEIGSLKICNFLVRVATTIIFTYWKQCIEEQNANCIIDLLTDLYIATGTYTGENAKLCDQYIHAQLDTVMGRFFIDPCIIMDDLRYRKAVMIVVRDVMQRHHIFNTSGTTCNFLKRFFEVLKHEKDFGASDNYNTILVNFASSILSVFQAEYRDIEELLLSNLLQDHSSSMFACDLWLLILSLAPPTLSFSTLDAIAGKYQTHAARDFQKCCMLRVFLQRAYARLPDALKMKWIVTYEAETRINLWALFGVGVSLPRRAYLSQAVAKTVCGRPNPSDFDELQLAFDGLEVLSTLYTRKDDLSPNIQAKLNALVTNLFSMDGELLQCQSYCNFLANSLLPIIVKLISIMCLDNAHLLQILNTLIRAGCSTPHHKLIISVVITAIAKTTPNEHNALTYSAIVKLLKFLSAPEDATSIRNVAASDGEYKIVNLYANAARKAFETNSEWMKNMAVIARASNSEEMTLISQPPQPVVETSQPFSESEPRAKKMKLLNARHMRSKFITPFKPPAERSRADEAQDILDTMKDGVRRLQKLAANGKWTHVSRENSQDIHSLVSKLQQFLYRNA